MNETNVQKLNRLNREAFFKKNRELNLKKLKNKNIFTSRKDIIYDLLDKNDRKYIEEKKILNNDKVKLKNMIDPEFINISSMKPENRLIIKEDLEDVYNSGDVILKDTLKAEFEKINNDFKKNLLTLMTLKDTITVISEFEKDYQFQRYFNINFPNLKKQLTEKYSSLDVKEFIFFVKEWYKNPKALSIKNVVQSKFDLLKKEFQKLKKKLKQKKLKHANNPVKLKEYNNIEAKVENIEEKIEDKREPLIAEEKYEQLEEEIKINEEEVKQLNNLISLTVSMIGEKNDDIAKIDEIMVENNDIMEEQKRNEGVINVYTTALTTGNLDFLNKDKDYDDALKDEYKSKLRYYREYNLKSLNDQQLLKVKQTYFDNLVSSINDNNFNYTLYFIKSLIKERYNNFTSKKTILLLLKNIKKHLKEDSPITIEQIILLTILNTSISYIVKTYGNEEDKQGKFIILKTNKKKKIKIMILWKKRNI